MKIANILVTHSFFPDKLLASVDRTIYCPDWFVFFHGHNQSLKQEIGIATQARSARYLPYGEDRGLARSWNEAIKIAISEAYEMILLLNDDLFFYNDGFDRFVDFCSRTASDDPTAGVVFTKGLESGGSPYAGKVQQQGFACCCLFPRAIERVGYFDENFKPAYFEDIDYNRRLHMAGLISVICEETLVEHERSLTIRLDPALAAANAATFDKCRLYYTEKWGGPHGAELYVHPFNNPTFGYKIEADETSNPYKRTRELELGTATMTSALRSNSLTLDRTEVRQNALAVSAVTPPPIVAVAILSPPDWATVDSQPVIELRSSDAGELSVTFYNESEYHASPHHGPVVLSGVAKLDTSVGIHRYVCESKLGAGRYVFEVRDGNSRFAAHSGIVVEATDRDDVNRVLGTGSPRGREGFAPDQAAIAPRLRAVSRDIFCRAHDAFDVGRLDVLAEGISSSEYQGTPHCGDMAEGVMVLREAPLEKLRSIQWLETCLLPYLGLNDEMIHEFPVALYPWCGSGLRSWQYPNQFSRYLAHISTLNIETYAEIGCRHGGTFIITVEYLKRFSHIRKAVAIDIEESPILRTYLELQRFDYLVASSRSPEVLRYLTENVWDLVLIDGDHSMEGCLQDYCTVRDSARRVALHDIASDVCGGVVEVWKLIEKFIPKSRLFTQVQQYQDVRTRKERSFLGLGIVDFT